MLDPILNLFGAASYAGAMVDNTGAFEVAPNALYNPSLTGSSSSSASMVSSLAGTVT